MACLPVESSVIKAVYKVSGKTGLCATLAYAAAGLSASCRKECSHNIQSAEVKNTANTVSAFHSLFLKKNFFMVLLFSSVQLFALFHPPVNQSAFARHTGHTVMFSWDFRGLHGSIYLSAYCPN